MIEANNLKSSGFPNAVQEKRVNLKRFLSPVSHLWMDQLSPLHIQVTRTFTVVSEIWKIIASQLDLSGVLSLRATCKGLVGLRTDPLVQTAQLYGTLFKIKNIPPIPATLLKELEQPCSSNPSKKTKGTRGQAHMPKIRDTHGIAYIDPQLTLTFLKNHAEELKKEGYPSFRFDALDDYMKCFRDKLSSKSGWVLYTKGIIRGIQDGERCYKSYAELEAFLAAANYEMAEPSVAGALILMHLIKTDGEYLCDKDSFTVCKYLSNPEWKSAETVALALLHKEVDEDDEEEEGDKEIDLVFDSYPDFDYGYDSVGAIGVRWY